jgi:hypothetical protein
MKFDDDVIAYLKKNTSFAVEAAALLGERGVTAEGILGALGEEAADRGVFINAAQDWFVETLTHQSIEEGYIRYKENKTSSANMVSRIPLVKFVYKLDNGVLNDVGFGNIKIATAIDLLNEYTQLYPDSDPLTLKSYLSDYPTMIRDLVSVDSPASAKFSGLMLAQANSFYSAHAPEAWAAYDEPTKDAIRVTYFNNGLEWATKKAEQFKTANPG